MQRFGLIGVPAGLSLDQGDRADPSVGRGQACFIEVLDGTAPARLVFQF
jgi:hypothetical protein